METSEKIIIGAGELFFSRGIKSVTMDDIAAHLRISKKTIYQFFRDKNDLVEAFTLANLKSNEAMMEDCCQQAKDPVEEIFLTMKHVTSLFQMINPNLFYDLQKNYPATWKKFQEFKLHSLVNIVERNIRKGMEMGYYRSDLHVKVLAKLRIEEVELGMNPAAFPPDKYNLGQVQIILLEHFLYGISTLKGHKLINKYKKVNEEE